MKMNHITDLSKNIWRHAVNLQNNIKKTTRSKTPVDPQHLKFKEKDISLNKNYCITISIQKISSIDIFILKIQQILGSHELKGHGHF